MCPFWPKLFGMLCLGMFFRFMETRLVGFAQVRVVVGGGSVGPESCRRRYACATALTCSGPAPSSARTPNISSKCGSRDMVPRLPGESLAQHTSRWLPAAGGTYRSRHFLYNVRCRRRSSDTLVALVTVRNCYHYLLALQ